MGTQLTKIGHAVVEKEPDTASLPSTPILTPKTKILDLDPRSPTANIIRTPIQISTGLNKNHTPTIGEINTDLFETSFDDISSKTALDPRSPSIDFTRTPIIIEKSAVKLRNKNLDNVRKHMSCEFSPVKKTDITKQKGPILLESSPFVKKDENKEKRKSYVGLLETNLDYVETNLDTYNKNKLENEVLMDPLPSVDEEEKPETAASEETSVNPNEEQLIEETKEELQICDEVQIVDKINQIDQDIKEVLEVSIDPTSNRSTNDLSQIDEEDIITQLKTIIAINEKPIETPNPEKEFDKKVTNLIYEDKHTPEVTNKNFKPKDANRTPLGDRNRVNHKSKNSISKLRVHDKPKGDYTVSKIPIFKDKKSKTQCENTPPPFKTTESRIKKSQWDTDRTLII